MNYPVRRQNLVWSSRIFVFRKSKNRHQKLLAKKLELEWNVLVIILKPSFEFSQLLFLILKRELKRKTTMGWLHAYITIAITAGVDGGYEVLPYCACPKCWTLDNDGITCIPSAGKVKTICRPNSISISIDDCVDRNTHDFTGRNSKFFKDMIPSGRFFQNWSKMKFWEIALKINPLIQDRWKLHEDAFEALSREVI